MFENVVNLKTRIAAQLTKHKRSYFNIIATGPSLRPELTFEKICTQLQALRAQAAEQQVGVFLHLMAQAPKTSVPVDQMMVRSDVVEKIADFAQFQSKHDAVLWLIEHANKVRENVFATSCLFVQDKL